MSRVYRLQRRLPSSDGTGKWCFVVDLHSFVAARHESVRDRMSLVEPGWQHRVIDQETGEVIRLDADGNPIPPSRTPEQEMADIAGDRYERAMGGEL